MKRVIWLVFLCAVASCVAANATEPSLGKSSTKSVATKTVATRVVVRQPAVADLAPADEYFGPFKLSIIGIRNTLRDVGLRYDFNHDIGTQTYKSAEQTEKSIRDWEHRYPRDDQLPRAVYLLQRLYTKVLVNESRSRAHVIAVWLFTDFKDSPQAKQLKKTIAAEHLAPIPAATQAPATPSPVSDTRYQSTFGGNYPSNFNPTPTPVTTTPATKNN